MRQEFEQYGYYHAQEGAKLLDQYLIVPFKVPADMSRPFQSQ